MLNLLSVGAAYGVLMLVFQDGRLEGVLDYQSVGGITSWLPLFLFVILFGLSMDYHVFILSRIREAVDRGERTDDAVAHGIKSTAGVVTSAAVVMVAVFAIFATLSMLEFKHDGRRPRGRGADRRDARPRGAAAGDDEAARRLELVPAEAARRGCRGSATSRRPSREADGPRQARHGGAVLAHGRRALTLRWADRRPRRGAPPACARVGFA